MRAKGFRKEKMEEALSRKKTSRIKEKIWIHHCLLNFCLCCWDIPLMIDVLKKKPEAIRGDICLSGIIIKIYFAFTFVSNINKCILCVSLYSKVVKTWSKVNLSCFGILKSISALVFGTEFHTSVYKHV